MRWRQLDVLVNDTGSGYQHRQARAHRPSPSHPRAHSPIAFPRSSSGGRRGTTMTPSSANAGRRRVRATRRNQVALARRRRHRRNPEDVCSVHQGHPPACTTDATSSASVRSSPDDAAAGVMASITTAAPAWPQTPSPRQHQARAPFMQPTLRQRCGVTKREFPRFCHRPSRELGARAHPQLRYALDRFHIDRLRAQHQLPATSVSERPAATSTTIRAFLLSQETIRDLHTTDPASSHSRYPHSRPVAARTARALRPSCRRQPCAAPGAQRHRARAAAAPLERLGQAPATRDRALEQRQPPIRSPCATAMRPTPRSPPVPQRHHPAPLPANASVAPSSPPHPVRRRPPTLPPHRRSHRRWCISPLPRFACSSSSNRARRPRVPPGITQPHRTKHRVRRRGSQRAGAAESPRRQSHPDSTRPRVVERRPGRAWTLDLLIHEPPIWLMSMISSGTLPVPADWSSTRTRAAGSRLSSPTPSTLDELSHRRGATL